MLTSSRARPPRGAVARPVDDEWRTRRVVRAARAGDREAMGELYVLHAPAVHAQVLRLVRDVGLGLVDRVPALKGLFIREAAGLTGDVPKLLRGETL